MLLLFLLCHLVLDFFFYYNYFKSYIYVCLNVEIHFCIYSQPYLDRLLVSELCKATFKH